MPSHRQLEAFYWAARLGTLHASADKLCTTQSAVTKRIQQLEQSLDVRLFTRSGKHNVLTEDGHAVLPMAEAILQQHEALVRRFKSPQPRPRRLAIGITEITAITWLPRLIERLKASYPGIQLKIVIGMRAELQHLLSTNAIQISIQQRLPRQPDLHSFDVGELRLMWVGGPDMDGSRQYAPRDIATLPIIRQNHESALSQVYDDWLSPHVPDQAVFTINSLIATASLVSAGQGISCLPEEYFAPMVAAGRLVRLSTRKQPPRITYAALFGKQDAHTAFYLDVARTARAACRFSA